MSQLDRSSAGSKEATEVITCQKCGKDNQDHYKFCLGCGAELARDGSDKPFQAPGAPDSTHHYAGGRGTDAPPETAAAPMLAQDSTHASPGVQAPPAGLKGGSSAVPAPNGVPDIVECPQCSHRNPPSNRFCASCGYKLNLASVPAKMSGAPHAGPTTGGVMLTALRADGTEAGSFTLPQGPTETVGRDTGSIFAGDSYLSPRHATFLRRGDQRSEDERLRTVFLPGRRCVPAFHRPGRARATVA
jgi:hypothetical protein